MMRHNRSFFIFALFLLFISSFNKLPSCFADVVWSEDFEDGDLDGWIIVQGAFAIVDGALESKVSQNLLMDFYLMSGMYHPSTVSVGTWSFDFKCEGKSDSPEFIIDFISLTQHRMNTGSIGKNYGFYIGFVRPQQYEIYRNTKYPSAEKALQICQSHSGTELNKWHHVDITRDEDGRIRVYVDGVMGINHVDKTYSESMYLGVNLEYSPRGKAIIDNIVVSDTIDVEPSPKKGFNIPGFPFESLITGLVTVTILIWISRTHFGLKLKIVSSARIKM
jgi:hypothetical protein